MARRRLRHFAGVWLLWQSLAISSPVLSFWASAALDCECGHGDGATCPMHKHADGPPECALRSTASLDQSVLFSFIESIAPAPSTLVSYLSNHSTPLILDTQMTIERPFSPDSPPPRF
jgi:hypothetical protein